MKILLGINVLTSVDSQVYGNHFAWAYHLGRLKAERDIDIILYTPWRSSIDRMRNEAAKLALETNCDYLMFVDDDMILQTNTLESLIDADKDIVMAHTHIRGYPYHPMSFKNISEIPNDVQLTYFDDIMEHVNEKGLAECAAVGFATVLIKTDILRRLEPPYFVTTPASTEDVYFCVRCQIELGNVSISVDTKCPTGHMLDKEMICPETRNALRKYYESFMLKNEEKENSRGDRGTEYHKAIEEL